MNAFMRTRIGALAFAGLLAATATAASQPNNEVAAWGHVAGWDVMVDRTLGDGCFVIAVYEHSVLRVGFDITDHAVLVTIGDPAWQSLRTGKLYDLDMQFDNLPVWRGQAAVLEARSFEKTLSTIADADWLTAFALSHTLVVSYQGREIERLSLKGTAAAVAEMLRCQQAMNGNREPVTQTDPFS